MRCDLQSRSGYNLFNIGSKMVLKNTLEGQVKIDLYKRWSECVLVLDTVPNWWIGIGKFTFPRNPHRSTEGGETANCTLLVDVKSSCWSWQYFDHSSFCRNCYWRMWDSKLGVDISEDRCLRKTLFWLWSWKLRLTSSCLPNVNQILEKGTLRSSSIQVLFI